MGVMGAGEVFEAGEAMGLAAALPDIEAGALHAGAAAGGAGIAEGLGQFEHGEALARDLFGGICGGEALLRSGVRHGISACLLWPQCSIFARHEG
jgi:hypothetical protein